jgi:8-oxo-dGTP diphosphatase
MCCDDITPSFPAAFSSYVPRHRKVYGCICVSPNKKILLVKGKGGKWSLPKGHMEYKESDIQCALRELYEETGIKPVVSFSSYKKLAAGGYFIFHFTEEPAPQPRDLNEIQDAQWFELHEIYALSCNLDLNYFTRWIRKSYSSVFNKTDQVCVSNSS